MCNFRVGQKVAPIKDHGVQPNIGEGKCVSLRAGQVFRIRGIQTLMRSNGMVMTGLLLEEVRNEIVNTAFGPFEFDYDFRVFRPVVERGTEKGMSILRDLLNKTDKPARVGA